MPEYRWLLPHALPPDPTLALGPYPPVIAQILFQRGVKSADEAQWWLEDATAPQHDPFTLPDMEQAVDRLLAAIRGREPVVVFGDFDADGITGTATLVEGLRLLGGVAQPYIPHRDEGYGLNIPTLEALAREGVRVVITVDTGTSAVVEIARARELGMSVIVMDHHAIPPQLPAAAAIVNPHRLDARYPFPDLSGVGVALKLLQALEQVIGRPVSEAFYDLAAIGTVADLAPLRDENRWIVQQGLAAIREGKRMGLRALLNRAGLPASQIQSEDLGFVIAPRINAMGRLEHAMSSYQLLTTVDETEAAALAEQLESTNRTRQQLTREMVALAQTALEDQPEDAPVLVVSSAEYPAGIIGLVASRLAEERFRPAIAITEGPDYSRGSARSIPGVSIVGLLTQCRDLFERYGGHPQAAGFTIRTGRIPELRERLTALAEIALYEAPHEPALSIDAVTPLRAIPGETMRLLSRLGPYGAGHPEPLFMSAKLEVRDTRVFGNGGAHLELKLAENRTMWKAVGFGMGDRAVRAGEVLDVAYSMGLDRFDGNGLLQLRIKDFRPTE